MKRKSRQNISFENFLHHIADETQPLSIALLHRLSNMGEDDLALFEVAWASIPSARRREVVRHLVDLTETNFDMECEPVFWLGLNDSDAEVREAAIDGLWVYEDVKQVAPLLKMLLHDPAAGVRAAAAGSLARFVLLGELDEIPPRQHAVVDDTLNALRAVIANPNEDVRVRRRAVEAIAYSGQDDVPGIILAAFQSPDEKMRVSAMCGMGRSADNRWKKTVVQELASPNPEMRYEAARAAGELELRNAVAGLAALLDDPDREVQQMAVWALGQVGGKQAADLLHKCCESGDELLSDAAADALEEMALMRGEDLPLFVFDPLEDEDWDPQDLGLDADEDEDE